jgi:phosphoesterase RecJ-like protein
MKCNIICNFATEKTDRIEMEDLNSFNIERLEDIIASSRRTAIVTHMKPDGDAIGSCTALYHYLRMCGEKSVKIVLNDNFPDYLSFLCKDICTADIIIYESRPDEAETAIRDSDLIFCLDFNAFHRTGKLEASLKASKADKVLIDHHLSPDREAFCLIFSETEISSASELLYQILMETSPVAHDASALPGPTATSLMTGMTTDTNNFANSVFPSTLRMASSLLAVGVDRDRILSLLYNQYSENRLRILGHMMKDLLTITEDGVAYIVLDKETLRRYDVKEGDTEGFVNMPLSIADVRMSLLLKEEDDRVRVSIRSKKGTSANTCARSYFNGGGHENAAGGKLNIPEDISCIEDAAGYIETHTHAYFTSGNEDNN